MQSTAVYRLYRGDDLLYVGITGRDVRQRLREHARREFASEIDYVTVYVYKSRTVAERVEATAIATENPIYNVHAGTMQGRQAPIYDGLDLWLHEVTYEEWAAA